LNKEIREIREVFSFPFFPTPLLSALRGDEEKPNL